mgnify:CR=1 FL=1
MVAEPSRRFTTKELSKRTWPDFERLFSQGNGWDHCWCTAYQGGNRGTARRSERGRVNKELKKYLVDGGRAHGILVYAAGEPVGWCQFGPEDELPISDPAAPPSKGPGRAWRITCFVTHKQWQHQGVARTALKAALRAIAKAGGGVVEAYPFAQADPPAANPAIASEFADLVRRHGPKAAEVKAAWYRKEDGVIYETGKPLLVEDVVEGVGQVNALCRWWGPAFHVGTVEMFEQEGFRATGKVPPNGKRGAARTGADDLKRYGATRLIMRKEI